MHHRGHLPLAGQDGRGLSLVVGLVFIGPFYVIISAMSFGFILVYAGLGYFIARAARKMPAWMITVGVLLLAALVIALHAANII